MGPGAHELVAGAAHPSGRYTAWATNVFTRGDGAERVENSYDGNGNVVGRVWKNAAGQVTRTQTLTWDGRERLLGVVELDTNNVGYRWTAVYDGLGRRWRAVTETTNGVGGGAGEVTVVESYYDPSVEFLEVGVAVNGAVTWKVYGPDLNGVYGGLGGVGGLEGLVTGSGVLQPVVGDAQGNVLGVVEGGAVRWNGARAGAYGPVAGYGSVPLRGGVAVGEASVWRGKRVEPTGYIGIGARMYDPTGGRFLSPDPVGVSGGGDLYGGFRGDPVNYFDPDGRWATRAREEGVEGFASMFSGDKQALIDYTFSNVKGFVQSGLEDAAGMNGLLGLGNPLAGMVGGSALEGLQGAAAGQFGEWGQSWGANEDSAAGQTGGRIGSAAAMLLGMMGGGSEGEARALARQYGANLAEMRQMMKGFPTLETEGMATLREFEGQWMQEPVRVMETMNLLGKDAVSARALELLERTKVPIVLDFNGRPVTAGGLPVRGMAGIMQDPIEARVFMYNNGGPRQVVGTIVHEGFHFETVAKGWGERSGSWWDEMGAMRRQLYYEQAGRPPLGQRQAVWQEIQGVYRPGDYDVLRGGM